MTITIAIGAGCAGLLGLAPPRPSDLLLYNPTPSMPVGFYVRVGEPIELGSVVTVRARDVARHYAQERNFVRHGDRFIKRIAAVSGARVCARSETVTVNGVSVGQRQSQDRMGRVLPTWSGCVELSNDQVLLMGDTPDSFDGRYWGVISRETIEGVWRPVLVKPQQQ